MSSVVDLDLPYQEDRDLVDIGSYRVLETFDEGCEGPYEPLRRDIRGKVRRALQDFPELADKTVTVGRLDPGDDVNGRAWFYNLIVNFPTDRRTPHMTVYHELGHLAIHVRDCRGEDVPITSEEFCSIFSVARMPPQLIDRDRISYLGEPEKRPERWPDICRKALQYREDNHDYIKQCQRWLGCDR